MRTVEHRSVWSALGGVILGVGLIVVIDWIVAAQNSNITRHIRHNPSGLYLGIAALAIGTYVFVSVLHERLWLPGRATIATNVYAEHLLVEFISIGQRLDLSPAAFNAEHSAWFVAVISFISDAWGPQEATILLGGPPTTIRNSTARVTKKLESLMTRRNQLELRRDFTVKSAMVSPWKSYLDQVEAADGGT